ncbi:MAG: hypothetical protein KA163_09320 [Bacteroidia bacterium]|nr:hypothetical protein [Bacteroidia bacterium]
MSHDSHNNNGHQENKPVAFTTPLILGAVTVFIILLFVSLGNPCHGHDKECCEEQKCSKECMEACEKGDHSKHPAGMTEEQCHGKKEGHGECGECKDGKECAHHAKHEEAHVAATDSTATPADTTHHAEPVKEEAHH